MNILSFRKINLLPLRFISLTSVNYTGAVEEYMMASFYREMDNIFGEIPSGRILSRGIMSWISFYKYDVEKLYPILRVLCGSFSCDGVDSLTVSVQLGDDYRSRDIGVYCGTRRPPMLMSAGGHPARGGHLQLTFLSTSSLLHQSRGFAAAFQFVSGSLNC